MFLLKTIIFTMTWQGFKWERVLTARGQLTMHTAYDRKDNTGETWHPNKKVVSGW